MSANFPIAIVTALGSWRSMVRAHPNMGPLRGVALGAALGTLLGACAVNQPAVPSRIETITANEAIAISTKVIDCEWQAVSRFDDGRVPIAQLAAQIMGVCIVERIKAKRAFGLSPNDPDLEADDFKQAVGIVESARKAAPKKP